MEAKEYLDSSIVNDFRTLINSTNIFYEIKEQQTRWNLVCVLLDRIDSSIKYLNSHCDHPKTEEELVSIFVFAAILKDGIYKFYENVFLKRPPTIMNKKWFSRVSHYGTPCFTDETCPTDDVFFEYLRSLSFAHPFETSKNRCSARCFMKDGEVHLSPWVICGSPLFGEDLVGVRVYTNEDIDKIVDMVFPYQNLKAYIRERYELIKEFFLWGNDIIESQNEIWKINKVNRSGTPIETIRGIIEISENRFYESSSLYIARDILLYQTSNQENLKISNYIKDILLQRFSKICDAVDNLDYETVEVELSLLYQRPKKLHENANYELEKIFAYLSDGVGPGEPGSNEEWGMIQARLFYDEYASKFVKIDFEKMNHREIQMLIRFSCIFGFLNEHEASK